MKKLNISLAAIGCALALSPLQLKADTMSYSLSVGNSAISGYPSPYGSVLVDRTSTTTANITFTGGSSGVYVYLFGGAGIAAVNVNATSFSFSSLLPGTASSSGSGNEDGFGSFNLTFKNTDGFGDAVSSVTFTLTDLSGTWADAAHVLTANSGGSTVAAHIFVEDTTPNTSNRNPATGYAGNGATTDVPDGGTTAALMGLAMLGLGSVRRILSK